MIRQEYRLAAGTIAAATLNGSTTYLIENFTKQSDMIGNMRWTQPSGLLSTFPIRQRSPALDQSVQLHGFYEWEWIFPAWTLGQLAYFETTFWSTNEYGAVTVKTRLRNGNFEEFTATMIKPGNDDFTRGFGGTRGTLRNVRIRFVGGEVV